MTNPKIALHRNTDSEKTGVIPPVNGTLPVRRPGTHPLVFLAFVVFLAATNASFWMSTTPVSLNVFLTGTSVALLLIALAGGIAFGQGKR